MYRICNRRIWVSGDRTWREGVQNEKGKDIAPLFRQDIPGSRFKRTLAYAEGRLAADGFD